MVAFVASGAEPTNTGANNMIALPDNNLNWKYPTEAMCKSFFVDVAGPAYTVRQDGIVKLSILGAQVDYTAAQIAAA